MIATKTKYSVVFQPICDLEENKTLGREVFLRGELPPEKLFAQANTKSKIINLDRASRTMALNEFRADQELLFLNNHPVTITYDEMLPLHLLQYQYFENVVLEITEQEIKDMSTFINRVNELKKIGLKFAIDDFGKGFSNLQLIELIEPDYIKLDKTIIENIITSKISRSIVSELAHLGKTINSKIIAEGIESSDQKDILIQCGISYGQGYYFAKPSPYLPLISQNKITKKSINYYLEHSFNYLNRE